MANPVALTQRDLELAKVALEGAIRACSFDGATDDINSLGDEYRLALLRLKGQKPARAIWREGYDAGWDDGVSDAMDDEPTTHSNPYVEA